MRSITTSCLAFTALLGVSQPVLEYANVDLIGKTFPLHLVTDPGTADPSITGADVTWDLSSITLQLNAGTTSFMDPVSTPYASSYPAANFAQVVNSSFGTGYNYFMLTSSGLDMLAEDVGGSDPDVYTDPKMPLQFPFAYLDSFSDDYTTDGIPATTTRTYSGYGTMVLPTGTYTNVVQVSSSSGTIDFYRAVPVEPLLHVGDDGTVIVFGDAITGIQDHAGMRSLNVMPNPARDAVRVDGLSNGAQWQLVDMQGRVLRNGVHRTGLLRLDLGGLTEGCYSLVAIDGSGYSTVRVVKE